MMDRRSARETAFLLLFENQFHPEMTPEDILRLAEDCRDLVTDDYTKAVFFGAVASREELDRLIAAHAIGWKTSRMSKVSLAIMYLALYEMTHREDIPFSVSINEAVELAKKYDYEKAPSFINGVLNSAAEALGLKAQ